MSERNLELIETLKCPIAPGIAPLLREKASLPHQGNPPATWRALDYIVAIQCKDQSWFCDGHVLVPTAGGPAWSLRENPMVAKRIAERPYPERSQVIGTPRAFPLGGLADGRMVFVLHSYDRNCDYVSDVLVLDPRARSVVFIEGNGLRGSEPKRLLSNGVEAYITGTVDAGAVYHLDDFIMAKTLWRIDMSNGKCEYSSGPSKKVWHESPLIACGQAAFVTGAGREYSNGLKQSVERRGGKVVCSLSIEEQRYRLELEDVNDDMPAETGGWHISTVTDGKTVLLLDLRRFDQAELRRYLLA